MLEKVPLAPNSSGQLHILHHDGAALGVDGEKVGVLHEGGKVHLSRFLKARDAEGT